MGAGKGERCKGVAEWAGLGGLDLLTRGALGVLKLGGRGWGERGEDSVTGSCEGRGKNYY